VAKRNGVFCAEESELAAIGCLLSNPQEAMAEMKRRGVVSRWFLDGRLASVFTICQDLHRQGKAIDEITIVNRKDELGIQSAINLPFLATLPGHASTIHQLSTYLDAVESMFQKRGVQKAIVEIQKQLSTADASASLAGVESIVQHIKGRTDNELPAIVPASEFIATKFEVPPVLVSDLLHRGSKIVISGVSKGGKTWLLLDLAVSVATQEPWLSLKTVRGKALYLNMEIEPVFFQDRLQTVCRAKNIDSNIPNLHLWHLRGEVAPWNVILPKITERIKGEDYALVIVDPLYKIYGNLKENAAEDMATLMNALGELSNESGAAIAISTHHSKGNQSSKESIDRISGSGVIARDADALLDFTANETEGAYSVASKLRNFKPLPDFAVRWDYPVFRRDDSIDPKKLKLGRTGRPSLYTPEMVLECLGKKKLLSKDWFQKATQETGVSRGKFYELIRQLESDKKVRKNKNEQWESVSPESPITT
jgi:hypothetical protein